ncbi:MAG: condensation domain-containing protein, partial [Acidobacteriota bacterium]
MPALPHEAELRERAARRVLSAMAPEVQPAEPPRNAVEETLARVWRSVLRLERIGVRDDFFRLGGDSILSLQIVARARQEGLALTPREIFENPTVAALAAVARPVAAGDDEERAEGEAALTPVQRSFLEQAPPEPHWFNQSLLLAAREPVDPALLAHAVALLPEHHDALRWTLTPGPSPASGRGENGAWIRPVAAIPFLQVDLSALSGELFPGAVEMASAQLQTAFDLQNGPVFLAAWFSRAVHPSPARGRGAGGEGSGNRLLLAAHHLVIDAVSWRILL